MEYDNNNTIAIFKNDKKGNEKAPDYRGNSTIDNKQYKVALWIRTSKTGTKYMSGKIELEQAKEEVQEADPFATFASEHSEDLDSSLELPF